MANWTTLVLVPFAVVGIAMLVAIPFHLSFLPKPGVIVIFDVLIGVVMWFARVPQLQEKKLVQTGTAVGGTVVESQSVREKTTMYTVTFAFKLTDGTEIKKRGVVSAGAFGKISPGQAVTVLYDSGNPQDALIYECCQYEAL